MRFVNGSLRDHIAEFGEVHGFGRKHIDQKWRSPLLQSRDHQRKRPGPHKKRRDHMGPAIYPYARAPRPMTFSSRSMGEAFSSMTFFVAPNAFSPSCTED